MFYLTVLNTRILPRATVLLAVRSGRISHSRTLATAGSRLATDWKAHASKRNLELQKSSTSEVGLPP